VVIAAPPRQISPIKRGSRPDWTTPGPCTGGPGVPPAQMVQYSPVPTGSWPLDNSFPNRVLLPSKLFAPRDPPTRARLSPTATFKDVCNSTFERLVGI
jgi:hypothetical protein